MPKLRKPENKYGPLQDLIRSRLGVLQMSMTELADRMGYCRQTMADRVAHPEKLMLVDLTRLSVILSIPADDLRAAMPI